MYKDPAAAARGKMQAGRIFSGFGVKTLSWPKFCLPQGLARAGVSPVAACVLAIIRAAAYAKGQTDKDPSHDA
jgi:hypothetical protein